MSSPVDARWPGVLDAIERESERLKAGAETPGELYQPPNDLGPLPLELRTRAQDIVASIEATSAVVVALLSDVHAELRRVQRTTAARSDAPPNERQGGFDCTA